MTEFTIWHPDRDCFYSYQLIRGGHRTRIMRRRFYTTRERYGFQRRHNETELRVRHTKSDGDLRRVFDLLRRQMKNNKRIVFL